MNTCKVVVECLTQYRCFRCPGDLCDKKEDGRFLSIVKNKVSLPGTGSHEKKQKKEIYGRTGHSRALSDPLFFRWLD